MECPICNRELVGEDANNEHHLTPKSLGGKNGPKITLHRVCHDKIHSVFSERELKTYYHTIERIMENPEMKKFVKWVSKKSPDFYTTHRDTNNRNKKRRK